MIVGLCSECICLAAMWLDICRKGAGHYTCLLGVVSFEFKLHFCLSRVIVTHSSWHFQAQLSDNFSICIAGKRYLGL